MEVQTHQRSTPAHRLILWALPGILVVVTSAGLYFLFRSRGLKPGITLRGTTSAGDCQTVPPISLGSGVSCVKAAGNAGQSTQITIASVSGLGTQTGNQVVLFGYFCTNTSCDASTIHDWAQNTAYVVGSGGIGGGASFIQPTLNNSCGFAYVATTAGTSGTTEPTWNTSSSSCMSQTGTISDGYNGLVWTPVYFVVQNLLSQNLSCFAPSPKSPYPLQNNKTYLNYLYYCPSMTADTGIQINCSVINSCLFISIFVSVYTGMCGTAPCFDTAGSANCTSCTSLSAWTGNNAYTNDLIIELGGTIADENLTANGGCSQIEEDPVKFPGNLVAARVASSGGVQGCGYTWSPADTAGTLIGAIKSANSVLASTGQFPRVYGMLGRIP